jgi:hypothetical protein
MLFNMGQSCSTTSDIKKVADLMEIIKKMGETNNFDGEKFDKLSIEVYKLCERSNENIWPLTDINTARLSFRGNDPDVRMRSFLKEMRNVHATKENHFYLNWHNH